jgi:hypothetical protein
MKLLNKSNYIKELSRLREWKQTITIRPSYRLKSYSSDNLIRKIADKLQAVIFYSLEKDRLDGMSHLHLLIDKNVTRDEICKATGLNPKAVGYVEPIQDNYKVTAYITKHIGNDYSHHNIF